MRKLHLPCLRVKESELIKPSKNKGIHSYLGKMLKVLLVNQTGSKRV